MQRAITGVQYVGVPGATQECVEAVLQLVQCRVPITDARIVTYDRHHCLLLTTGASGDLILVNSGFTSGYAGTGPARLSEVLGLLYYLEVEIDECDVLSDVFKRAEASTLTVKDVHALRSANAVLPSRWPEYIREDDRDIEERGHLFVRLFRPVIPFAIVDPRLADLAKAFWSNPDQALTSGYRRLEDNLRGRIKSAESGRPLFAAAFLHKPPKLTWRSCDQSEHEGRAQLFVGATMAYRNPRAHRELKHGEREALAEFLLLNQLFRLEASAIRKRNKKSS